MIRNSCFVHDAYPVLSSEPCSYGSTKCGLRQLQASLLKECKRSKVGIHTASPGMVLTELLLRYTCCLSVFCWAGASYCGYDLNYLMRLQIFAYLFLFCSRTLCACTVRLFLPLSIKLKLFTSLWTWICSFTMFLCTGLHQMKVFFVDHLFAFEIVLFHLVTMLSLHAWFGSFAVARH